MLDENKMQNLSDKEKAISLFEYIKELNELRQKVVLNVKDYPWYLPISNIPVFPECIKAFYHDNIGEEQESDDLLLLVRKPEFEKCPVPSEFFVDWLLPGWNNYHLEAEVREKREFVAEDSNELSMDDNHIERFVDDDKRVAAYQDWQNLRKAWVGRQEIIEKTRNLFADLYQLYFELQREVETKEIIVANGMLQDSRNPDIMHPVLTRRVKIEYNPVKNVLSVYNTESSSELYSSIFQQMEDVNLDAVNNILDELRANDYHPLDRNDTPDFLKMVVHQLSSDSVFSTSGIPDGWNNENRLLLYLAPCYIVRKKIDGVTNAIEKIIENIQQTEFIPAPILDIVNSGTIELPEDDREESIEEQLAAVGGESVDVLLSKEANKEQLEIAQSIEHYNAVLVQGPPGTGKTHTIANLMGHFIAQGKSILVTSHTQKALNVLKEKVVPGLQSLCVSVLDDSSLDVVRSVNAITSYMTGKTSGKVKHEKFLLESQRKQIIKELAEVRRKIFTVLNQERCTITYNGEEISPSEAARFVLAHEEDLSYIPGSVQLKAPLPLTLEQLTELYQSNLLISAADEEELANNLPNPEELLHPTEFDQIQNEINSLKAKLMEIEQSEAWSIKTSSISRLIEINGLGEKFTVSYPKRENLQKLFSYVNNFKPADRWMRAAASDGKTAGPAYNRWKKLIEQIEETCQYAEKFAEEKFGVKIDFEKSNKMSDLKTSLTELKGLIGENGKIPTLKRIFHKELLSVQESVKINGEPLKSPAECDLVIHAILLEEMRQKCAVYWEELLTKHGAPKFKELDENTPEFAAYNWIPLIKKYLTWYGWDYIELKDKLRQVGFPPEKIFRKSEMYLGASNTSVTFDLIDHSIPKLCEACLIVLDLHERETMLRKTKNRLLSGKRVDSIVCSALAEAITCADSQKYLEAYISLDAMYKKYDQQQRRMVMLNALKPFAPQWANAIENRVGIHGKDTPPTTIIDAWKWKQLSGIIDEITSAPLEQLQDESIRLSKKYKEITAEYAEKCGWYHLLRKVEADGSTRKALEGWKQTVSRIGKGTGKNAPRYKAKARELMAKCQGVVPCWIMPISRALENLDPKENQFDIVIIDEASQSDLSSLAILYMGRKFIIVGDDKQVSPMGIGADTDKINALEQMYIQGKIPNSHLYNAKTSIYDIAATTFQPLMLREHFRCVPEIIGFSNMLSYDYKIKPLRDASSSTLLPAVVNYRVTDGQRMGKTKTNPKEAETIVALMKACIEQDEYQGKTFAVISLLGDEQVKIIQREIEREIDAREVVARKILCGNSANFQGDERDVVFLSLVDSSDESGPLPRMEFGPDEAIRKRYNVATSRARDQLWVVHSLDAANDLKSGDIRKRLIDYVSNPGAFEFQHEKIKAYAESPFEEAVASSLSDRGYHIIQQWKVGAYRLDMVAIFGKKAVAIECDGERWHSGEEKIREDMERQTILERLGWRFIRIRGSEYYRAPEETIERVISELESFGIEPEDFTTEDSSEKNTSELLDRVKICAAEILEGKQSGDNSIDLGTIQFALTQTQLAEQADAELSKKVVREAKYKKAELPVEDKKTILEPLQKKINEAPIKKENLANPDRKPDLPQKETTNSSKTEIKKNKTQKLKEDALVEELQRHNIQIIDNRKQSDIIWVIYEKKEADRIKQIINKFEFKATFESRGAIATGNRSAWRVMTQKVEKDGETERKGN